MERVCVIGLGKLGLPFAVLLASRGFHVTGYDYSENLVSALKDHRYFSSEPRLMESLAENYENMHFTNNLKGLLKDVESIFVIVPTPSNPSGAFVNDFVVSAINEIGKEISLSSQRYLINIVSTVMPGSCESEIKEALEESSGRKLGPNLGLCYNPEFIALGSVFHDMENPDMHLIGASDEWAGMATANLLKKLTLNPVPVRIMGLTEAELVKISVNNFVTMKISFANALFQIANRLGNLDIDTITDSIGLDSRVGSKYLKAAMPYGGPCFPRDTRAFSSLSNNLDIANSLSQATEKMNESHLIFLANLIDEQNSGVKSIGILGLSYKVGTPVTDESPGINLARELMVRGYEVKTWDDEGAVIDFGVSEISQSSSLDSLISSVDLIVVGRPHKNWPEIRAKIQSANQKYLDLWRQ
jgi:UDPglucose 6-dehydrogenase